MTDPIGHIRILHGQATATSDEGVRELSKGDPVFEGETISTGHDAALEIRFLDNTILSQGQDATLSLDEYVYAPGEGGGNILFGLVQGSFRSVSGAIVDENPDGYNLKTPLSTIGIRGTSTAHNVPAPGSGDPTEDHLVLVYDGKPVIVVPIGNGELRIISASGQKVEVSELATSEVTLMTQAEFIYYQQLASGQLEDGPPQYGSPDDVVGDDPSTDRPVDPGSLGQAQQQDEELGRQLQDESGDDPDDNRADDNRADLPDGQDDDEGQNEDDQIITVDRDSLIDGNQTIILDFDGTPIEVSVSEGASQVLAGNAGDDLFGDDDLVDTGGQDGGTQTTTSTVTQNFGTSFSNTTTYSGSGSDTIAFTPTAGNSSFNLSGITGVESITLGSSTVSTTITPTNDATVAAGETLTIDGSQLTGGASLTFDGTNETDGYFDVTGGSGNDSMTGSDHNADGDVLTGGAGDDTLVGKAGNDTVSGGEGNDTLHGNYDNDDQDDGEDQDNDSLDGGEGNDFITGGRGDDTITAGTGDDEVEGNRGDDVFLFGANLDAGDTVIGGDGSDELRFTDSGAGTDDLSNVEEVETLTLGDAATSFTVSDSQVGAGDTMTIDGSALGTANSLVVDGSNVTYGNLHITGGDGNDTLTAGAGGDSMDGGAGDDVFIFGTNLGANDTVTGGAGSDELRLGGSGGGADLDNVTGVEILTLADGAQNTFTTTDSLVGSGQTLTVDASATSSDFPLTWNGTAETDGNFSVTGGGGADDITGGAGNDTLSGGAGSDTLTAGSGSDNLSGGAGNDTLVFGTNLSSADTVTGGDDTDQLTYTAASSPTTTDLDNVTGVESVVLGDATTAITTIDALVGSGQTLSVDASALTGSHTLTFNGGAETDGAFNVTGGATGDTITGGDGGDTLAGGTGADLIYGGDGADTITGGDGNDTLSGGGGADAMDGGAGDDTLVFNSGDVPSAEVTESIDGGTGTDTIRVAGATDFSEAGSISNVEQLLIGAGQSATFKASQFDTSWTVQGSGTTAVEHLIIDAQGGAAPDLSGVTFTDWGGEDRVSFINTAEDQSGNIFNVTQAGTQSLTGTAGDDTFNFGTYLDGTDSVDGGAGTDTLNFTDSNGATDDLDGVTNVESVIFGDATTSVTTVDSLVGAGETLLIDGSAISGGKSLTFDGSAETDGAFNITGSASGGDSITTGAGDDTVNMGSNVNPGSSFDGGAGTDTLIFTDNGSGTNDLNGVTNVEKIVFGDADTDVKVKNNLTAANDTLTVDASNVSAAHTVNFDYSSDSDSGFDYTGGDGVDTVTGGGGAANNVDTLRGGGGNDVLDAGAGDDTLFGQAGSDTLTGGDGADTFTYNATSEGGDSITDFSSGEDTFKFDGSDFSGFTNDSYDAANDFLAASDPLTWNGRTDSYFGLDTDTLTLYYVDLTGQTPQSTEIADLDATMTGDDIMVVQQQLGGEQGGGMA